MAISNTKARKGIGGMKHTGIGVGTSHSKSIATQSPKASTPLGFKDTLDTLNNTVIGGEGLSLVLPNGEINESAISALQDAIHMSGEQLLAKPGYDTVIAYKKSVQMLLQSIVPLLHKKEDIIAPKKINGEIRERKFTLINKVNEKLDTVLKLVLTSQTDQMNIMKTLDEIKGLLINILY